MRDCYIVVERSNAEGVNAYAFVSEEEARRVVKEEVESTAESLRREGKVPTIAKYDEDNIDLFVADSDFYFEWSIIVSQIR